ncbi:proton-coupled folate transporter [Plakobranchus ocellatus]|uniref:Proton-coupled folate transporter n=1 Tax=Plakobranchus ocellatus TaxID=259542 RepID=A0AAV4DB29_9GAST|nr:proton-coupled folate transporter [Plakobranchus ocellatus]
MSHHGVEDANSETRPLLDGLNVNTQSSFHGSGAVLSGYWPTPSPRSPHIAFGSGTMAPPLVGLRPGNADPPAERETDQDRGFVGTSARKRAKFTLPFIIISYFMGYMPSMVIMNPYIYDRIAEEYNHRINTSSQVPCGKDMNNVTGNATAKGIQEAIERRVSTLELYLSLTTYLSAILPILFLGPFTDKLGRKAGFLLPMSATLGKQVVYIIVIMRELPLPLLYLAHGIEALGGSFAAILSAMFSVTSDVTQPGNERSGWIAVMEALQTLAASLGQVIVAQWMRFGYLHPLIYALAFCCLGLFLTIFVLPETNASASRNGLNDLTTPSDVNQGRCFGLVSTCWKTVRTSFALYGSKSMAQASSGNNLRILSKRRLCLAIFILTVAVNFSRPGVETLFQLKYPLCWPATKVYTFSGLRIFLSWVVILCALALMQKLFKMADRHICTVGIISSILTNAALSLSVNSVMVYEAAVVGVMTRSIIPMLRSILSSLVPQDHQGAMYSSLSCVESFGASVFSTISNRIYYVTLSSWAGLIFMIFACIMILALILIIILNVLFVKETPRCQEDQRQSGNIQADREDQSA